MPLIDVDPDELLAVAGSLDRALEVGNELTGSSGSLASQAWAAGSHDASSAITDFLNDWTYGIGYISSDGQRLSRLLRLAGSAYEDAERAVAEAAG